MSVTQCAGEPNSCSPNGLLPSLLLIGTRKGGTTALSSLLKRHPSIRMPDCKHGLEVWPKPRGVCVWDKEVRYFSRAVQQKSTGLCWYRSLYRCPHNTSGDQLVAFDGSPDYLVLKDAAVAAMAATLGRERTRLVVLLRNPADRFYSAYNMGMSEHLERLTARTHVHMEPSPIVENSTSTSGLTYARFAADLNRLIACAPACPSEPNIVSMFFSYGMYATHLRVYTRHFGRERLLVERSEDFYEDGAGTVRRVLAFSDLSDAPWQAATATSATVGSSSDQLTAKEQNIGRLWGGVGYAGKLQVTERRKLQKWYAPHNRELYAFIGRDMQWEQGMLPLEVEL